MEPVCDCLCVEYSYDWNTSVLDLKNQFPHWTADDLLNLRRQFEIFDTNKDRLLDFSELWVNVAHSDVTFDVMWLLGGI